MEVNSEEEGDVNAKKLFLLVLFVFIAGAFLGLAMGAFCPEFCFGRLSSSAELRKHLEQANRDLLTAIDSQREAAERASKLQAELQGITEYARELERGTRYAEARAESLADKLSGAISQSGELRDGINRAHHSLAESRILLDELGNILRGVPGNIGKEN